MAAMATAAGVWGLGVNLFLLSTDEAVANAIVHVYYLAPVTIPLSLIGFGLCYPRQRRWSAWAYVALGAGFVVAAALAVTPGLAIKDVVVGQTIRNTVVLDFAYYRVFALYFVVYLGIASYLFWTNYREVKRQRQTQLLRQMRIMAGGMVVAVLFGMFFNLLLPFFGEYSYLWAGPLFTILFVVALFYAIIKERLFDLRAALARSIAYFMLVASLAALYWFAIYGITSLFFLGRQMTELYAAVYVGLALIITLTYMPLKRLIDRQTYRLFYRSEYNLTDTTQRLSDIMSEEIQLVSLVHRALELLDKTLAPEYIAAYITDANGKLHHYTIGQKITPRQRKAQLDVVSMALDRMPRIVDTYDMTSVGDSQTHHLIKDGQVSMILQFVVQHEHIGALFIGDKRNGRPYDDKDMQLLRTTTDELALAIQNSLRFGEIQHFNETLKESISTATEKLRRTNRELQKLDQAKDEFLSMASHQLRTPLTSIKGYLSMVIEGDAGKISDQQRQLLNEAFVSSERMVHLIADFLSVSRLQTGKFVIETQSIDLSELVRHEVEALKPLASSHHLKLDYTAPVSKRRILVDENKIQQVVMNLIDNAIFYSRPDTTIKIDLQYVGNELVFTVKDTGIGVPLAEQPKLFVKFFRATNARQQRPDGTGVGLYLAKKVVTAHGGGIIFHSEEGKGSTFGFRLPLPPLS